MYIGFFEPIVMFFRMTNSPAIFQAIMNCHKLHLVISPPNL